MNVDGATREHFEVVVVGGGAAGLSAALILGRARRKTLVLDAQQPRNAPAAHAQGIFTRDGTPPLELLRIARDQLVPYGVKVSNRTATHVCPRNDGFLLTLDDQTTVQAHKILLATGMKDLLPAVPGFEALWGKAVHHCPYCHGWEVRDQAMAVYGKGTPGYLKAKLLHNWSQDLILCTDGPSGPGPTEMDHLGQLGIRVIEKPVSHLVHNGDVLQGIQFKDGSFLARQTLFLSPEQQQHSSLPAQLGCKMDPEGLQVWVDAQGQTSVPGVYAAGDMVTRAQQVMVAAASGVQAAAMLNHAFLEEGLHLKNQTRV
ncbi:NAD(P)/FAD-dependent oxidoreductase [Deinococcus cellulosilyticus]|uniref:Pyridine nucleotide-disulfide oxidoreductase n=1 Tax=Deinococcus cellulosilyticus (strain DSM 18568 / NBRC 106333 / KACC 11606 / 5516J-15) TaxID=1223518 RepID=A0A511N8J0_DEIC1|nr:NAD(P)/FAD-dependent oxidoreductase [Deinococcus cellulosilyticus]GEM49140.1 pyridine nucleotide-disulfide oxidoreductase [Deinococcus cellulosilyticus NBRC 106333 = KACC 11606]